MILLHHSYRPRALKKCENQIFNTLFGSLFKYSNLRELRIVKNSSSWTFSVASNYTFDVIVIFEESETLLLHIYYMA